MNKPLRRVAIFCGLLILALLVRGNWLQYVQANELATDDKNRRVPITRYSIPRGDIIVNGKAITGSVETTGDYKYKRTWKDGAMWAPVTGFSSQAFGSNFLENLEDGILSGTDDRLFFRNTLDMLTGKQRAGGSVVTTLNAAAQKAAYEGLAGKKGAAAAIDPTTGKILALVSTPSYDPSKFAGQSTADGKAWTAVQKKNDPDDPMLNRALRETYPPGSTFKVVTAAAALENGIVSGIDDKTDTPDPYRLPQSSTDLGNEHSGCENANFRFALEVSCNTVFAKMSDNVGNKKMIAQAEKFGFNEGKLDVPVRAAESVYPEDNRPQNALDGIGQGSNRATPLQMAMVAAAVANDGKLMKPYMVDSLKSPNLDTLETTEPKELSQAVSSATAQKLQDMMETVVETGTGKNAQIDGVKVGGKTGTAQHGLNNSEKPYAWFISYAKLADGSSPVAVAVVVEDGSAVREDITGGGLAAPVAKAVMQAVIGNKK
ncbi:penicillin-binding transpeptidase domain-containing protein [Streptomyces acidiscabies]|uniref:Penicillin-binding transpeptidase domain-containing protein n=1 Tax=Streptomyces acidiscabies TaxID=42234 RepID=A0AAP6BL60_9ACTN|nr:penicillin-binding transpeptidase domain-containing protein [Streptomyces acidiscabies]MBP5938257.1 penicillin-binding protein 2 [Streptomyces sp. LBUM 1476]MBZ3909280.1 penicillin-binding protein 2 [Streptomyces acidiscabies]MDX2966690.1 penicillin-binding transpeptidase domain-containing protein [Streptomyces acidiscabies]MDX3016312.1 penicillin-binding transpeptidase domain-containing protein [Streptomyces acidiscabies]MDX3788782.1 penicillin-binding transpeptidase domain-containing prot